jgi:nucleoid DNA-binding protein
LIEKVDYIVQTCVEATNQTIVDDLKKKGTLTDDDKRRAFNKTFESVQNMLTDEDKQKIADNFGDISTYVTNSVENYIKTSKIENIDIPI